MTNLESMSSREPASFRGHRCAWWGRSRSEMGVWNPAPLDPPVGDSGDAWDRPQGVRFTRIAAGNFGSAGITTTGSIVCWGYQFNVQGPRNAEERLREGVGGSDWIRISCRRWGKFTGVLALRRDGTLGQAGFVNPKRPTGDRFVDVASSSDCDAGLREDGRVWSWSRGSATPHLTEETFVEISGHPDHVSARRADGRWVVWSCPGPPRELTGAGTSARRLFLGSQSHLGLDEDGTLVGWGDVAAGVPLGERFRTIARGTLGTLGLRMDGRLDCWSESRDPATAEGGLKAVSGRGSIPDDARFVDVQATKLDFIGLLEG